MKYPPIERLLKPPSRSFFLFGPRGTGKSTWLKRAFPKAVHLDLLDASLSLELTRDPHRLEAIIEGKGRAHWVILDEIQKIPSLLEEVHRLMESRSWRFALCGSSARKLKRGGADLLGGRALTSNVEPRFGRNAGAKRNPSETFDWHLHGGEALQIWQR